MFALFIDAVLDAIEADPSRSARVRAVLSGAPTDAWIPLDEAARIAGAKVRVLTDEHRKGRITLGRGVVQRSELDRWLSTRPTKARTSAANDTRDARAEDQAAFERSAARLAR